MTSLPTGETRPLLEFEANGGHFIARIVQDTLALECLKVQWQALDSNPANKMAYFQSFDWCRTWWVINGEKAGARLRVLAIYRDKRLVAVWPLMKCPGPLNLTQIVPVGYPLSQYSNLVHDPAAFDAAIGGKIWKAYLRGLRADCVVLPSYPEDGMMAAIVGHRGIQTQETRNAAIQNLTTYDAPDALAATLSAKMRKNRRARRNKLAREGEISTDVHAGGSEAYLNLVNRALEMKQDWLIHNGRRTNAVTDEATARFLAALPGHKDKNGTIEGAFAYELKVDGKPVAIELGFIQSRHVYAYIGAFDWACRALSPGKIQMEASVNWAIETGMERYDYLGEPADYKEHWSDEAVPLVGRSVPNSLKGWLYCHVWVARTRPMLAAIFDRLSPTMRQRLLRVFQRGASAPASDSGKVSAGTRQAQATR